MSQIHKTVFTDLLVVIVIPLNVIHHCGALLELPTGSWFNKH